MRTTLAELAALVGGNLLGDGQVAIESAAVLRDVQPGQITLVDKSERLGQLASSAAAAAVVPVGCPAADRPVIEACQVHAAFARIVEHFRPPRPARRPAISPAAWISPTAKLAADVAVGPGATIGDDVEIGAGSVIHAGVHIMAGCRIGDGVTIFPGAVLYEDTVVGHRCLIHACAVLGAYGFGYSLEQGRHVLSAQLGNVELGDDVEIGPGTTIDRGTYGPTRIGPGTKIDDQVMVAHNCQIGPHNILCSQVGIAGSSSTGAYVVIAGQAGIRDHVHIGEGAMLGAMSGVMGDVPARAHYVGIPATPDREQMTKQVALARLPEMRKQLRALQETVDKLAAAQNQRPGAAA